MKDQCKCGFWYYSKYEKYHHDCSENNNTSTGAKKRKLSEEKQPALESKDASSVSFEVDEGDACSSQSKYDESESEIDSHSLRTMLLMFLLELKLDHFVHEVVLDKISAFIQSFSKRLFTEGKEHHWDVLNDLIFGEILTRHYRDKAFNNLAPCTPKKVGHFSYLPLIPQVKRYIEHSGLENFEKTSILNNNSPASPFLSCCLQGEEVKRQLNKCKSKYIVPISLFFDEVSHVNAIGSFASRSKHSVFQWKIVNSSQTFVLGAANSSDLETPVTASLNELIEAFAMEIRDPFLFNGESVQVLCIFVTADNLAGINCDSFI